MTRRARRNLALAVVALALATSQAHADDASDPAAAEVLFREGHKLKDAGDQAAACAKFAGSYALDRAPGTLLNLAECSRNEGKTATAWSQFVEAEQVFRRRQDERRASFAAAEAKRLEPKLARVVVRAADRPPGLVVRRDGATLSAASLETSLPVDPGSRTLTAEAPGFAPRTVSFEAVAGKVVEVRVPTLTPVESPGPAAEPAPPNAGADEESAESGDGQRIAGWIVGGAGVLSVALGGVFVGLTAERRGALDDLCPGGACASGPPADALSQAHLYANLANGLLVGGVVTAGVGLVVLLTAPDTPEGLSRSVSPTVACGVAACVVTLGF